MHKFETSLSFSHSASDEPFWEIVYRKAFHGIEAIVDLRNDGFHQRAGIDRAIVLSNSKQILIDEKVRAKDYSDILLERWSDKDRQIAGWMQKPLLCDYIAYAFLPSKRCFLLPFQSLRTLWIRKGRDWIGRFKPVFAPNKGYITESVPVPIDELLDELRDLMIVTWI